VINHTLNQRTTVVVSTVNTAPAGITVSGRTISWPDDGWYQMQTEDGNTNLCQGGRSCVVPTDGTYILINHTTGTRTTIEVGTSGSSSTDSSGTTVSGRTISWPADGWYQVQTEDGLTTVCEGGTSCTVPFDGTYVVINHTTGTRTTVAAN
jgi:flagellar basal body rod protein FlgG